MEDFYDLFTFCFSGIMIINDNNIIISDRLDPLVLRFNTGIVKFNTEIFPHLEHKTVI